MISSNTSFSTWFLPLVMGICGLLGACESSSKQTTNAQNPTFYEQIQKVSAELKPYFGVKGSAVKKINNPQVLTKKGWEISTEFPINDLSFSPDNQLLASCGIDAEDNVQIWDMKTGKLLSTAGKGFFHRPVFTPDNRFLIYTAVQKIEVWDIPQHQLVKSFSLVSKNIALNSEGYLICEDSALRVFQADIRGGTARTILSEVDVIVGINYGASNETLEMLNRRKALVWEKGRSYRITHDLVQPITSRFSWRNGKAALINETGRSLTIKNEKDEIVLEIKGEGFFEKQKSTLSEKEQKMQDMMLSRGFYDAVLFSPDGKYLTAIYHNFANRQSIYFLRVFDLEARKMVYESEANKLDINVLAFSVDGKYLTLGLGDNIKKGKGKIIVYDFETLLKN